MYSMPLGRGFESSFPLFGMIIECRCDVNPDVRGIVHWEELFAGGFAQDLIHDGGNAWLKHGGGGRK